MKKLLNILRTLVVLEATMISVTLSGQSNVPTKTFQPFVGQGGKDVVWVPTPQKLVDAMLDLADVRQGDLLIDLGSGDGRTVITAASRGVKAIGVEYNPDMVDLSKRNAAIAGVSARTEFIVADLFEYDFSKASVVTMFLLPDINLRLRPVILKMKPGTRVVSNTFTMGGWIPDDTVHIEDTDFSWTTAYLWIVPASVEGSWTMQSGEKLVLIQDFQMVGGEMEGINKERTPIKGKITGTELEFTAGDALYTGRIEGNIITGKSSRDGNVISWTARR